MINNLQKLIHYSTSFGWISDMNNKITYIRLSHYNYPSIEKKEGIIIDTSSDYITMHYLRIIIFKK